MIVRLAIGIPLAALVTFALFTVMRLLVIPDSFELEEESASVSISITREVRDESDAFERTRQQRPERLDNPPPPPQRQTASRPNVQGVSGELPDFNLDVGATVDFGINPDRDAQPLVRIEPRYPERALQRGTEGWVLVQFDVTPEGTTINCEVIESEPPGMFDREACRAVDRWRYQPKIVDGNPAPRFGVQTRFDFQLAEE